MVYESDFYTTRRPYTRPISSSYTVTGPAILPLTSSVPLRYYHPHLPYVAHKRLVTIVHTPVHGDFYTGTPVPIRVFSRVRPSIIAAELNRIRYLPRPSSTSYTEKYLNSKDHIFFDDETRDIRAKADSLLSRIHVFVPRTLPSEFAEEIVPERMRSDDYVRRLLNAKNNQKRDIDILSWYAHPEIRDIKDGNLACVRYVGGRPQSRRRPYYKVADLRPADIKNDVNLLSYYSKNRTAAAKACPSPPPTEREIRRARALAEDPISARVMTRKAPEPVPEAEPEVKEEIGAQPELGPIAEGPAIVEKEEEEEVKPVVVCEKKEKKKEKKQKDKDVRKLPDVEALQRAEEFLARQKEEARLEELRRKALEEDRRRLEKEEDEARRALEIAQKEAKRLEVIEMERLEAARKAEEERLEAERKEAQRIAHLEYLAAAKNAARVAAEEEERHAEEKAEEELHKKQTEEERLTADAGITDSEPMDEFDHRNWDSSNVDIDDREKEENPIDIVNDDDEQVEEVAADVEIHEVIDDSYVAETDGFCSQPEVNPTVEETPQVETSSGNEQPEVEAVIEDAPHVLTSDQQSEFETALEDAPQVETSPDDEEQVVEVQATVEESQVEEEKSPEEAETTMEDAPLVEDEEATSAVDEKSEDGNEE